MPGAGSNGERYKIQDTGSIGLRAHGPTDFAKAGGGNKRKAHVRTRPLITEHNTPHTKHSTQPSGFTLLEVLAAVAILAIVLVAVFRLHFQTIAMTGASKFYTLAPLLAQTKLTELDVAGIENATPDGGDFGSDMPGYRWRVETEEVLPAILENGPGSMIKIEVTVSMNDEDMIYRMRTYRFVQQ
ncbi:hypothetical protein D3OALGB2SA_4807 [Olavius algarvensis associated proteobacterium Delta 3]|nr:hypothetical protein D3OALGB2SA_4807 [Olavius algarvensis associated proteobacterium Delta 3]